MSLPIKLPELGEGVTEGELVKWLVKPGDTVRADQPIAEIMTDKATVEVPSPVAGVVQELHFKPGDTILVEKVILTLQSQGGASAKAEPKTEQKVEEKKPAAQTPSANQSTARTVATQSTSNSMSLTQASDKVSPPPAGPQVLATPSTRRLARELNVDLNQLPGTGLAGRVTREDVVQAHGSGGASGGMDIVPRDGMVARSVPSSGSLADERVPLRGIRKKIAENMQMAKRIIPHFTLMDEAEVTELVALRESLKPAAEKAGVKITYLPFVMKALIASCRKFPQFNASIDDQAQEIVYKKSFNVGFAADTPNGLVVPVIKNADQKTILQLAQEILDLSRRARDGKLKSEEMKGATITITNIGSIGGTYATPIINHPEVAILGMYKLQERLVLGENGQVKQIKMMNFTITADHRLIDGAVAANFLKDFTDKIQSPGRLMLEMI